MSFPSHRAPPHPSWTTTREHRLHQPPSHHARTTTTTTTSPQHLFQGMQQTNSASLATAKCMPIVLGLIIIYVCYVIIHPLTINFFLHPPRHDIPQRLPLAIAIPVVYFVLLIPVVGCYGRLLMQVVSDPGYIELGTEPRPGVNEPQPGLEEFYNRDAFVCDESGLPLWCALCKNYKHDRGHHNQDTGVQFLLLFWVLRHLLTNTLHAQGRCTMRMDHFCPWVGGVVGER